MRVHVKRVERLAGGHEEPVALDPAEAEVGAALREQDASNDLARRIEDRHTVQRVAAAPPAPEVAVDVAAHTVRNAVAGVDEKPVVGELRAAVHDVEYANLARHRAAHDDVELRLVGREAESVGPVDLAGRDRELTRPPVDPVDVRADLGRVHMALVVAEDAECGIAEPY